MNQGISYAVDLVLCIDATGSMSPIIDRVKQHAVSFSHDLTAALDKKGKYIDSLRLRVIAFRDFYFDEDRSIEDSGFFSLPDENAAFKSFIEGIRPSGGGDEPETGLEALAMAIDSPWSKGADRNRQIIVMWTDASAHPLEKDAATKPPGYPTSLPKNLDELTDWWDGQTYMDYKSKRLILFTPDAAGWSEIGSNWDQTVHLASQAGDGLEEHEYSTILDVIANSV